MKKIGLLSDTHGYLDEAVFTHFEKCDEIWHAGDFGNVELAKALSDFKPLRGVYGNVDGKDVRQLYPETLRFAIEGMDVFMIHIGGYPDRYAGISTYFFGFHGQVSGCHRIIQDSGCNYFQ